MADAGEVTNGELARRIDRMDKSNHEHFDKIFSVLDSLGAKFITQREFDQRMGAVEAKIEKAVDRKWALLIGGFAAIATGVITVIAQLLSRAH